MSEDKMRVDGMAGFAAPPFQPILSDAGAGPTFTMLGTTIRLIATAAGTGGRHTVIEQVTNVFFYDVPRLRETAKKRLGHCAQMNLVLVECPGRRAAATEESMQILGRVMRFTSLRTR